MSKRIPPFLTIMLVLAALVPAVSAAPLTVNPTNPRYFTDGSGKAVYLTGSHDHSNLQFDVGETFDYSAYLSFLQQHNHNFIRLWVWEHPNYPTVYARTGPGSASDGLPKYNLDQFNQEYFDRLRSEAVAARDRGIYVSIMLFQGWSIEYKETGYSPWSNHPFLLSNNINGVNGDANGNGQVEETHTLQIPAITVRQEAYVRKVIDTVNDLDNVLYEISNEDTGGLENTAWQYHMINYIKSYESGKPKRHPVGMTVQWPSGSNAILFQSPADWISPNYDGGYMDNPPAADGSKVVIPDTDHLWGLGGNYQWVWKSFIRGLNPIFMDYPSYTDSESWKEQLRLAMGHTLTYANRMNLASMTPQNSLSSTSYCLANPSSEYLVYQPGSGSFTVNLQAGTYSYEWFNPGAGSVAGTGTITASGGSRSFTPPFSGDAVLYLKAGSAEPYCGDGSCNGAETCSTCPGDCGSCPSTNPIAHWKLDETSGTAAADSSGNGNTGTLINGAAWASGKVGGALSLDGVDDYVNIGKAIIGNNPAFSVSAWFKTSSASKQQVYYEGGSGTIMLYCTVNENIVGDVECGMLDDLTAWAGKSTPASSFNNGQWHHLVFVQRSKNERELFVDGLPKGTDTAGIGTLTLSASRIGSRTSAVGGSFDFFSGAIDDVRIYNRALNASEIQALYQAQTPSCGDGSCNGAETCSSCPGDCGTCPEPIAHWKLDEGSGTTASDSSGNGNTGTLLNGPSWTTGKLNNSLSFDGVDDYVTLPDMGTVESYPFTFTAWFRSSSSDNDMTIVSQENSGDQTQRVQLYFTDGLLSWNIRSTAAEAEIQVAGQYRDGNWHHVAGVSMASNNHEFFVDGVSVGISAVNVPAPAVNKATIGNWFFVAGYFFTGAIDDVRIYNRALSSQEVQNLYQVLTCHKSDTNCNSCVEQTELTAFIDRWKVSNMDVTLKELIEAIGLWKAGTGCY